jgi:alpha-mannosidase
MDRRNFLKDTGSIVLSWAAARYLFGPVSGTRLSSAEVLPQPENPDWTVRAFNPRAEASSYSTDLPGAYDPSNVIGTDMLSGWQALGQMEGAWLKIQFPEAHPVCELWIQGRPLPRHVVGQNPYLDMLSRASLYAPPRRVRCTLSDSSTVTADLRDGEFFQIVRFPEEHITNSVLITVEGVWTRPGAQETGIAKVKVFPHPHEADFEIDAYPMYDARNGQPLQAGTLHLINPGDDVNGARLVASQNGARLMEIPLDPIPARSADFQHVWIPAPFEDAVMEFRVVAGGSSFGTSRSLRVPAYHFNFDKGVFAFDCTCHNDLGWLDTQEKTADYRTAKIILPALELLQKYPEFRYSMESTVYLMEFLERHPEKREDIAAVMRERRFSFGASYIACLEAHVGPEKLARQFYWGRRWLKKNFPGVDTRIYYKVDPPALTLQMPQILTKAGVKYLVQGRMPFGYYWWQGPDGSTVFTYATASIPELDPKGNEGWLHYAGEREQYYASRKLPHKLMFDYWSDYLAPQPDLLPYVREQNLAMKRFAETWNDHYASDPKRQIHPPRLTFTHCEEFLEEFTKSLPLDITTLSGDWPINWDYYDEPAHRKGLLAGRLAHNRLLTAERIYAGLSLVAGFQDYPKKTFDEAWLATLWPDHGWGGNRGVLTDQNFVDSYEKSQKLADEILEQAGSKLARAVQKSSENRTSVAVFNPLTGERTDVVHARFQMPAGWSGFALRDESGKSVPYEILEEAEAGHTNIAFVAEGVPSLGYSRYFLEPASSPAGLTPLTGDAAENEFFKVTFGAGGIKSLYDKRLKWEVLQTDKFDAGEVLQFTAPGNAFDDSEHPLEDVGMQDFDQTSHHAFPFKAFTRSPIRTTAVREAAFEHFRLREKFHLYHLLDRIDIELELIDWDGQKERELRAAFPINLSEARLSYEVPFGTVEMGKDELNFSLLPSSPVRLPFSLKLYGGDQPLPFREAINWVDASDQHYLGHGCLSASDCTVHRFHDETNHPASYPVLQHALLSTRKSIAWNPVYWFTQKGSYRYRMSLLPHGGDWRSRYREAIGFNYPLLAFVNSESQRSAEATFPADGSFFRLEPGNLVLTTLKKCEDDDHLVIRFYEAEGFECQARLRISKPITRAWTTNLIEEEEQPLQPNEDGSVQFHVRPWEIVTLKVAV